jgi:hypothetical protein
VDIKKLLILVLIPVVAYSADPISPRRDSLRTYVYRMIPADTAGTDLLPKATVNLALNLALDATSRLYPAVEKLDTVVVDSTTEGGTFNSDFLRIYKVHRIVGSRIRAQLLPLAVDTTQPLAKDEGDYIQSFDKATDPAFYYTFKGMLMTQPKIRKSPAFPDSFLVSYYALAPGLANDSDTTVVLKEYRQAVIYWAVAFCQEIRHRMDLVDYWLNKFGSYRAEPVERKEVGKE